MAEAALTPQKGDIQGKKESNERKLADDLKLFLRFWPFARTYRRYIYTGMVMMPLSALAAMAQPYLLKEAIDVNMAGGDIEGLLVTVMLMLGTVLAEYFLRGGQSFTLQYAGFNAVADLRKRLYEHVMGLSAAILDNTPTGNLLTRSTNDVESLGDSLSQGLITIFGDLIMIGGILSIMLWLDVKLTLISLIAAPFIVLIVNYFRRKLREAFLTVRKGLATVNGFFAEHLYGVKVIQLFNREAETYGEFKAHTYSYLRATQWANVYDATLYALMDGMASIAVALMLWYGAGATAEGAVTIGLLVSFVSYLQRIYDLIKMLSGKFAQLQQSVAALERVFGLLDTKVELAPGSQSIINPQGHVLFEDLTFAYGKGPDVLHQIDLEISPGQVVALVGSTGSGKTTLGKLLNRTYGGYRGHLKLDGVEVADAKLEDLRAAVGIVRQDVTLFKGSIAFNISLGNPSISEVDIQAVAKLVQAHPFISELPGGYEFEVTEGGGNLSAGQAQLIAFARAMAQDPPIIVLDEATASVDSQTEAAIQRAIETIFERKTVLVIAHRLSTIRQADQILVMDKGRIAEKGNHETLLKLGGIYAQLHAEGFESNS